MTKLKIVFAPGSMDSFDGTQEELDAIVAEVKELVESGAFDTAIPITKEEEEELQRLYAQQNPKPTLQ